MARSLKNLFAPINRLPVVVSFIPDYSRGDGADKDLITLTHVCRAWRSMFTSRSSLWTNLNLANVDKTRTYIQRSKIAPLKIYLDDGHTKGTEFKDAFPLVIPHIHRLKSLVIDADVAPDLLEHLHFHAPLLTRLSIEITGPRRCDLVLDNELFNGDLSSLRELILGGIPTRLHWNNMKNLRVLELRFCHPEYDITRLLDVFESAPLLRTVQLIGKSLPASSNALPNRMVTLPHLNRLVINMRQPHSILLNHLCIPTGASMTQSFSFRGERSPLLYHLPERFTNLGNLSDITAVNLLFDSAQKFVRLSGPSGCLRVRAHKIGSPTPSSYNLDSGILLSLLKADLSMVETLSVSGYCHFDSAEIKKCPIPRTLSCMNGLQTLVLIKCNDKPFIIALTPSKNASKPVLCPNLQDLTLYAGSRDQFHIGCLLNMAKKRASRGAKLSLITLVSLDQLAERDEVLKLREYVTNVEYMIDSVAPAWDGDESDGGDSSDESDY